mgnify:CR=1 FL=1
MKKTICVILSLILIILSAATISDSSQAVKAATNTSNTNSQVETMGVINIVDCGAIGDGVHDNVTAFRNAVDRAIELGVNAIYIPDGIFRIVATGNSSISLSGIKDITIFGNGESSVIKWDDDPNVAKTYAGSSVFYCNAPNNITLRNFKIQGSLMDHVNDGQRNAVPMLTFWELSKLTMDGVILEQSRFLATQITNCDEVILTNNKVRYSIRDGLRVVNASNVIATGNYFFNVSDDSIAVSTNGGYEKIAESCIITDNIFRFSQGVKALGCKKTIIANNIFSQCHYTAIDVKCYSHPGILEGFTVPYSLIIEGNQIYDSIKITGSDSGSAQVYIRGPEITADSQGNLPSVTVPPYKYYREKGNNYNGLPAFHGILIRGNIFGSTLANGTRITDLGFGPILDRSAPGLFVDEEIKESTFKKACISFGGCLQDVTISDNIFSGIHGQHAVYFYGEQLYLPKYTGVSLRNINIKNNIFSDMTACALYFMPSYLKTNVKVEGNTFDMDPFFRSILHNSDNTWSGRSSGEYLAVAIGGSLNGVILDNNTFANCYTPYLTTAGLTKAGTNYSYIDTRNNINRGVAVLSETQAIEIDGDPTSPTFGQCRTLTQ